MIRHAVEWHQRLQFGELDEASQREFSVWLQTPAHVEELAHICTMDTLLQAVFKKSVRRDLPKNVIDFDSYASVKWAHPHPRPRPVQRPATTSRFDIKAKLAAAASVAVAAIATLWLTLGTTSALTTTAGRWDKQLLEDGTVVYVAPNTTLRFHFTDETRGVTLVRGEALFEVAKEPSRPFIVSTDEGTVRAVGTVFSTADRGDTVVVTVAEGKVAITARAVRDAVQPMVHAIADQQVVLSPTGVSTPVSVDADHELKWVRDWYQYKDERVGDVIARLNSLNEAQVIVNDPAVLLWRVNLPAFKPSQPEVFVRTINRWYAGHSEKASANALRIQQP